MNWTFDNIPDQNGRTCVITGANSGIGYADATILSQKGCRLILACRNLEKASAAANSIRSAVPTAQIDLKELDLSNLSSVHKFAEDCSNEYTSIDLLINNAGVMIPPKTLTKDGFELQFGTNHLGHFLLTGLLLPLLNKAASPRVVTVSSVAHKIGKIDFDNLNAERRYSRWGAYAQSKLANIIFAIELQRRLEKNGSRVLSLGAHPGGTKTELGRNRFYANIVMWLFCGTPEEGAMPSIRAATDPNAKGGEYYGPANFLSFRGPPVKEKLIRRVQDKAVAEKLWLESERLTGAKYP